MMIGKMTSAAIALGLALSFNVDAAAAQGNGRGNQRERPRVEQERDLGAIDILRGETRRGVAVRGNGSGKVPPGWCQGVGNPHNTPENCGYNARTSRDRSPYEDDRRYDARGGSYEESHRRFHLELDDYYNRLAAQRPLDVAYQLELRLRKRAEHDEWHRQTGISH
jgi:hypothetical protein